MTYFVAMLASSSTAALLFKAFCAGLSDTLPPAIAPITAGLVSWSLMILVLTLPPVEKRFTIRPRFGWLICSQVSMTGAIGQSVSLWRLPGGHHEIVLVLLLSIPVITATLVTSRALFTRAEIDSLSPRRSKEARPEQAPSAPAA